MRKLTWMAFLFVSLSLLSTSISAQSSAETKPKKFENPQWKTMVMIDYLPGKYARAKEIIQNYFMKAGQKAGTSTPLMQAQAVTGEWDLVLVWEMKGGISDMDWDISPDNIKWRAALNEITGSEEKTKELQKEYSSLVNRSTSFILKSM